MVCFTLSVDSTADLYYDFMQKNDIRFVPLTFSMEKDGKLEEYLDDFKSYDEYVAFYNKVRSGYMPHTAMLNYESHYAHFRKMAEAGENNVLHFTISSGLAPTITVAQKAYADIKSEFPDFNLKIVDPLTATIGTGILAKIALECRDSGMSLDETYDKVMATRLHIQHYIIADDLNYLCRGGRVSRASAIVGTALGIKPIITFDKEGKLFVIDKVRGMRKALSYVKAKLSTQKRGELERVVLVHTDNLPVAEEFAPFLREEFGIEPEIVIMGPTIGTHVGPNAFACGFVSKEERNEI